MDRIKNFIGVPLQNKTSLFFQNNYITSEHMGYNGKVNMDCDTIRNNRYMLMYVISGNLHFDIYDKKYILHSGESFIMSLDDPHWFHSGKDEKVEVLWSRFNGKPCEVILKRLKVNNQLPIFSKDEKVKEHMLDIFELTKNKEKLYEYKLSSVFYDAIMNIVGEALYKIDNNKKYQLDIDSEIYNFVKDLIYVKNIQIEDFCKYFNMGKTALSKFILAKVGMSPMKYVNEIKIDEVKKILIESESSLSEISQVLFFSDQSHMSRIFKEIVGMTPNQYRKAYLLD